MNRHALSLLAVFVLGGASPALVADEPQKPAPPAEKKAGPSLYERLGGVYPIAVVVDDFLDRVVDDSILNANPRIKAARDRVPKAGLKYRLTEQVCQVTGGPCTYTGRSMKDAHAAMSITDQEFDQLVTDFRISLDKFKVPAREQQELLAIVASTKADIVTVTRK